MNVFWLPDIASTIEYVRAFGVAGLTLVLSDNPILCNQLSRMEPRDDLQIETTMFSINDSFFVWPEQLLERFASNLSAPSCCLLFRDSKISKKTSLATLIGLAPKGVAVTFNQDLDFQTDDLKSITDPGVLNLLRTEFKAFQKLVLGTGNQTRQKIEKSRELWIEGLYREILKGG